MKQINKVFKLFDLIGESSAFGNEEGRTVYNKLLGALDQSPESKIVGISLKGLKRTDASFPRESVISLAKAKRGEMGFYLQDFESKDLVDNWDYAAKAKDQPMIIIKDKGFAIIGPDLSSGSMELLEFIMKKDLVTTAMVAERFELSVQNASGKLKKLLAQGLILGSKEVAETGGLEYLFKAIKKSD